MLVRYYLFKWKHGSSLHPAPRPLQSKDGPEKPPKRIITTYHIIRWWFGTFSKINIIIPDSPSCCQSTPRFIFLSLFSPCEPLHLLQLRLLLLHTRQCTVHLIPKCVHHSCCFTICLIFHQRIIGECGWRHCIDISDLEEGALNSLLN